MKNNVDSLRRLKMQAQRDGLLIGPDDKVPNFEAGECWDYNMC